MYMSIYNQNTPRYSNKYRGMDQINQAVDPM